MREKFYKRFHKKYLRAVIPVLLLCLSAGAYLVTGKYVHQTYEKAQAVAERFIFVSDYPEEVHFIQVHKDSVELTLSNHEAGLHTVPDISYNVIVRDDTQADVTSSVLDASEQSGTLTGGVQSNSTITLKNLIPDVTYTVTVTSTVPYVKELTAAFRYVQAAVDEDYYTITKYTGLRDECWMQLDIFIGKEDVAALTIDYSSTDLAPDNADVSMRNWTIANGIGTLNNLTAYSQFSYIFFGECKEVTTKTEIQDNKITFVNE